MIDSSGVYASGEQPLRLNSTRDQESWNYEATVQQIEEIMARIEAGDLELAEVFDQFGTAVEYLRQCESFLKLRQRQMDLLIETLEDQASN